MAEGWWWLWREFEEFSEFWDFCVIFLIKQIDFKVPFLFPFSSFDCYGMQRISGAWCCDSTQSCHVTIFRVRLYP